MKAGPKMEKNQILTIVGISLVIAIITSLITAYIVSNDNASKISNVSNDITTKIGNITKGCKLNDIDIYGQDDNKTFNDICGELSPVMVSYMYDVKVYTGPDCSQEYNTFYYDASRIEGVNFSEKIGNLKDSKECEKIGDQWTSRVIVPNSVLCCANANIT